jgi:hypothetical protein
MRFFIIFYLAIQSGWSSYYGSGHPSSASYSQNNSSSIGMALNLPRIDIRIANFISTAKEMERKERENGVESQIPLDWYKLDEDGEIVKGKNFQNHILKILIKELIERFEKSEISRSEMVENILVYLNEFIGERFIPGAYQAAIKKIFGRAQGLQHAPVLLVTTIAFKEMSKEAQDAFREGKRVQASGLERAPTVKGSMHADPLLVELLFMQLVWDAQKRCSTRQELLNTIEKSMVKMEQLFGSDPAYTIVGTFSSLRSTLVEKTQEESPLAVLIKYIISMITDTESKKELEELFNEHFEDKDREEWEEIIKGKSEPAVSIWIKEDLPPKESEEEKRDRLERERENQADKARKKAKLKAENDKKLADKEGLKKLKDNAIDSAKNQGIATAKGAFDNALGKMLGALKGGFGSLLG